MKAAIDENHQIMNAMFDKIKLNAEEIKKMNVEKTDRFPNTKAAMKESLNKQIDGKTLIAISIYVLIMVSLRVLAFLYPQTINPFWEIFGDVFVGVVIWVICLLFNIKNPSAGKVIRDVGQWIMDMSLDPEDALKELRNWYAVFGRIYMQEWDKLGDKVSEGILKVDEKID